MSRYSHDEHERRFLAGSLPAGLGPGTRIHDRYLEGTRLRLRRMAPGRDGRSPELKLGQKIRPDPADPTHVLLTTVYLSEAEYALLAALPAHELRKTRHRHAPSGAAIDRFEGHLAGLILLEADFGEPGPMAAFRPPPFVVAEVSHDDRFSGGALAALAGAELPGLLADYGLAI